MTHQHTEAKNQRGTLTEPLKRTEPDYMFCVIPVEEHRSGVNNKLYQNNTKTTCETPTRGGLAEPLNKEARKDHLVCLT